jgi:DNA polymerase III epsilon subunit-like protein
MADPTNDIPPLRLWSVVVVDTETTGLLDNPHAEVLEIAVVGLDGSVLLDTKVRPVQLDAALAHDPEGVNVALNINGYEPRLWNDAPTFAELSETIVKVFEHKVIVGQNPNFDRSFILRGLENAGVEKAYRVLSRHVIDTTTLAWEHLVPCGLDRLNLNAICEFLGIDLDRTHRHGALADAQACRAAYLKMLRPSETQTAAWHDRGAQLQCYSENAAPVPTASA